MYRLWLVSDLYSYTNYRLFEVYHCHGNIHYQARDVLHDVISDLVAFAGLLAATIYNGLVVGISLQFVAEIDFHVFASKESNSDP